MKQKPTSHLELAGVNIRHPWAELILSGKKTIETRSYALPEKYRNRFISIIETYGVPGKRARIIGLVKFSESKLYRSKSDWTKDYSKHLVSETNSEYRFQNSKPKWGWSVSTTIPLSKAVEAPLKKGIRFATKCRVPVSAIQKKLRVRLLD